MCYSAKSSLSAWIIITVIAVLLWYRNYAYDRILAAFVIALGLIQLIEYGIHNDMNSEQGSKLLFVILWLQCFLLSVGVYWYSRQLDTFSTLGPLVMLIVFTVILAVAIIYVLCTSVTFEAYVGSSNHIEWYRNGQALMGSWGIVYLIGIFVPLFILLCYSGFTSLSLYILIGYGILSALLVYFMYPLAAFSSMWCYVSVGFVFLCWMVGIFGANSSTKTC